MAGSKGCGANMRVTPVGLLDVDLDTLAGLAQLQAGLTHGHPTGLAASELTAYAVRLLRDGAALAELPGLLTDRAHEQRTGLPGATGSATCGSARGVPTPAEFIARGWDECLRVLARLDAALARPDDGGDPCRPPARAGSPRRRWPPRCSAPIRHADDPVGRAGPGRHHRRRLRLHRRPGRRLRRRGPRHARLAGRLVHPHRVRRPARHPRRTPATDPAPPARRSPPGLRSGLRGAWGQVVGVRAGGGVCGAGARGSGRRCRRGRRRRPAGTWIGSLRSRKLSWSASASQLRVGIADVVVPVATCPGW